MASSPSRTFRPIPPSVGLMGLTKACFGVTAKPTRETRALPRNAEQTHFQQGHGFRNLSRVQTNLLQRTAHYYRSPRRFDITLVVWNEDAWKKCFHGGLAVA